MRFEPKYSLGMRALHWLVFLAALIAVVTIEILDAFPKGSAARAALFAAHQTMGLSVLALMVLRMLVRVERGCLGTFCPPAFTASCGYVSAKRRSPLGGNRQQHQLEKSSHGPHGALQAGLDLFATAFAEQAPRAEMLAVVGQQPVVVFTQTRTCSAGDFLCVVPLGRSRA